MTSPLNDKKEGGPVTSVLIWFDPEGTVTSFNPVTALERGLSVLAVVNRLRRAKVADVRAETGLDKATIIRMLETLIHAGYVVKDSHEATYFASARTMQLSCGFNLPQRISETAGPVHAQFHRAVGWPSDLAIRDGDSMIMIHSSNQDGVLHLNRPSGFRAPMLMTCLGRAYLAWCNGAEQERIVSTLAAIPGADTELAREPAKLKALLAKIRAQGYAINDRGYGERMQHNLWALGVPIKDDNNVYASLGLIVPADLFTRKAGIHKYLITMQRVADKLAAIFQEQGFNMAAAELYKSPSKKRVARPMPDRRMRQPATPSAPSAGLDSYRTGVQKSSASI
jgi:IclR family mhp operon transcriptional activator